MWWHLLGICIIFIDAIGILDLITLFILSSLVSLTTIIINREFNQMIMSTERTIKNSWHLIGEIRDYLSANSGLIDQIKLGFHLSKGFIRYRTQQFLFPPVEKLNNHLMVNYAIGLRAYKLLLPYRKTNRIHLIQDAHGKDVTHEIKTYLGPCEDCHGQNITPGDLNYGELIFTLYNKKVFMVGVNDSIRSIWTNEGF